VRKMVEYVLGGAGVHVRPKAAAKGTAIFCWGLASGPGFIARHTQSVWAISGNSSALEEPGVLSEDMDSRTDRMITFRRSRAVGIILRTSVSLSISDAHFVVEAKTANTCTSIA